MASKKKTAEHQPKKEPIPTETRLDLFNKLWEIDAKQRFMAEAIVKVWGDEDSVYGDEVVFGGHLVMQEISDGIRDVLQMLDPDYKAEEAAI